MESQSLKGDFIKNYFIILFKHLCYETYCSPGGNTFLSLALSQQCKLRCSRRVEPNCISEIWSFSEDSWKQKEKKSEYKIFSPPHHRFGCKCSRIPKKPRKRESHVLKGEFVKSYSFGPRLVRFFCDLLLVVLLEIRSEFEKHKLFQLPSFRDPSNHIFSESLWSLISTHALRRQRQ